jgi:hypothetical protein
MKITFEISDESVKLFTDKGVKKKDIPKLYMHIVKEELGQNSLWEDDFIREWLEKNEFFES